MQALIAVLIVGTTAWVGYDASGRDWSGHAFANRTWKWVVGSLLLWIVVFPVYLVQRGKVPAK
jgi:hypothetical protein